jgi:hypothetical protein
MREASKKGGINRMKQLSAEERLEFSRKGNLEKSNPSVPRETHSGVLKIGDTELKCGVLSDGRRVLSCGSITKIMGRGKPNADAIKKARGAGIPSFLTANNLKPFVVNEKSMTPALVVYKSKEGKRAQGYECSVLTLACDAYLSGRDAGVLSKEQLVLAKQCEIIMRGLAKTGLIALIDECTGYQEVRDKFALQAILDKYLRKEFAEWAKRFPPSFYEQIFRLNNWEFSEVSVKRPMIIGKYTNDVVYNRLVPELVEELQEKNPKTETGYRAVKHHQWLSEIGNMDLEKHISATTALMRCCKDWREFKELLDKVYPVKSTKEIFKKE